MTEVQQPPTTRLLNLLQLLLALLAAVVVFLPFASSTSPLDAVTLRVPGNQGNWWHVLVGAPFFLAFPLLWLRVLSLASRPGPSSTGRRILWIVIALSICATISVETPFLLHLAGTSEWQRLAILSLGFGIVIASGVALLLRRHAISPTHASLVGLNTAYLANAALCLAVYSNAQGPFSTRSGWLLTMILSWPMALEVAWIFSQTFRPAPSPSPGSHPQDTVAIEG